MVSPRYITRALEKVGFFNSYGGKGTLKKLLNRLFVLFQFSVLWTGVGAHFFNTVTRSTRFSPDFFQAVYEDCFLIPACLVVTHMSSKGEENVDFVKHMEKNFSKADEQVIQKCKRHSKILLNLIVGLISFSTFGAFMESLKPLTEKDLEIRRIVYQTKHPERRHPYTLRFPFVDESESWAFEVIFVFITYWIIIYDIMICLIISDAPVIVMHLKAQYEILSKFIRKVGARHVDLSGNEIFYTKIEKNEFQCVIKDKERLLDKEALLNIQNDYEQRYLKQIVQFHHKLLIFQEKMIHRFRPYIFIMVLNYILMLSTNIYQIMLFDPELSSARFFKVILELICLLVGFFFMTDISEMADDCNSMMLNALMECSWENCSTRTQKDIGILMRRVQEPNHLKFYYGTIVLSRVFLMQNCKLAYSFLNYLNLLYKG